jgi:hypothetical protein
MLLGPLLGVPRIDLAPPGTVKALPGSFSTPRTGQVRAGFASAFHPEMFLSNGGEIGEPSVILSSYLRDIYICRFVLLCYFAT